MKKENNNSGKNHADARDRLAPGRTRDRLLRLFLRASILCLFALTAAACEREHRRFSESPPGPATDGSVRQSELQPGSPQPAAAVAAPYSDNAWAVSEGKRLYGWFNCVGCHEHGGGNMGPALMDDKWIYGSQPQNIFETIVEGRPNGMPSFRGKIPDQQVWQIVAYVRSMSGQLRKDVSPSRDDEMNVKPAEQSKEKELPVQTGNSP